MPEVRLIDANALKARLRGCVIIMPNGEKCMADRAIDTQGTIEAEPVRHGRLIKTHLKGYYKCSACMFACTSNPDQRFCSYCGAKLDGGVEE